MTGRLARAAAAVSLAFSIGVVAGPSAHAAFPGENGRIVFDQMPRFWEGLGPSNLFSVWPDGTGMHQLTDVGEGSAAWHPSTSPDGARIVYVTTSPDANDQIWMVRANGSHAHVVVDEPDWFDNAPAFTANGKRVLYSRCGFYVMGYWTCKIVSVRLDGSDRRVVIGGRWHPAEPSMAPGGDQIAYTSDKGGTDPKLWLANADGSHQHSVGLNSGVEGPSWLPDGTTVVFTGDFHHGAVFTIGASDMGPALDKVLAGSIYPSWSPDGSRFVSKLDLGDEFGSLRITWPDGSHPTVLVDADMYPGYASWGVAS